MIPSAADFLELRVEWDDTTPFGTTLSGRLQAFVRQALYADTGQALLRALEHPGSASAEFLSIDRLAQLVRDDRAQSAHAETLAAETFWHPPAQDATPQFLYATSNLGSGSLQLDLTPQRCQRLRDAMRGQVDQDDWILERFLVHHAAEMEREGFRRIDPLAPRRQEMPLLVGHACVTWADRDARLWVDPFLRPKTPRYPHQYQPLSPLDFPDAQHVVLLTHSHLDHFDPASLFWFPNATRFIIPQVERESILSLDLELRLRQLGFSDIETLAWWESRQISGFEITALPFYGEQPLGWGTETQLADYNVGNIYLVRNPQGVYSLLMADSGSDPRMSCLQYARRLRRELGRIDYLFANHRRWRLYPPQYLLTSVPQFLCYASDDELHVQQQIMLDPEQLACIAEALDARFVIPYAMGGARWYEEIGLGYDHLRRASQRNAFDASPREFEAQRLGDAALYVAPHYTPLVMFPGQSLAADGSLHWLEGMGHVAPNAFKPRRERALPASFVVTGDGFDAALAQELAALTTLDRGAFLLGHLNYCEVYTSRGQAGELLRAALAQWFEQEPLSYFRFAAPLSGQPFCQDAVWFRLFRRLHRQAFTTLRDGEDILAVLRRMARRRLFATLPTPLLEQVCLSLIGLHPQITLSPATSWTPGATNPFAHRLLPFPPEAADLVSTYSATATGLALLLIKLIHNIYCSATALGKPLPATDETQWFEAVLGAP